MTSSDFPLETLRDHAQTCMNTQLINSLVQLIHSLSPEERAILEEKLFFEDTYPSPSELITLSLHNKSLNFLAQEPDLYTLDDGEPIR